jgi:hypothetical protein
VKATQNKEIKTIKINKTTTFVNNPLPLKKDTILLRYNFLNENLFFLINKTRTAELIAKLTDHDKTTCVKVKILKKDNDSVKITTKSETTRLAFTKANLRFEKTA